MDAGGKIMIACLHRFLLTNKKDKTSTDLIYNKTTLEPTEFISMIEASALKSQQVVSAKGLKKVLGLRSLFIISIGLVRIDGDGD
jgi:hypothetical protein